MGKFDNKCNYRLEVSKLHHKAFSSVSQETQFIIIIVIAYNIPLQILEILKNLRALPNCLSEKCFMTQKVEEAQLYRL